MISVKCSDAMQYDADYLFLCEERKMSQENSMNVYLQWVFSATLARGKMAGVYMYIYVYMYICALGLGSEQSMYVCVHWG